MTSHALRGCRKPPPPPRHSPHRVQGASSTPTPSGQATCSSPHMPFPSLGSCHAQARCPCPHQVFPGRQKVPSLHADALCAASRAQGTGHVCTLLKGGAALPALESREHVLFLVTPQACPHRALSEDFVAIIKVTTDGCCFARAVKACRLHAVQDGESATPESWQMQCLGSKEGNCKTFIRPQTST